MRTKAAVAIALAALACAPVPEAAQDWKWELDNFIEVRAECEKREYVDLGNLAASGSAFDAAELEQWIASHRAPRKLVGCTLRMTCGLTYERNTSYREACRGRATAFFAAVSDGWSASVCPIEADAIIYSDGGVCLDTFIPGREALDCLDFVEASAVLEARKRASCRSGPSESAGAAQQGAAADRQGPRSGPPR
jgi:hypothetical protein